MDGAETLAPVDLAILGGGLAGGLTALAISRRRPELRLAVIEQSGLGGNHVWSHFAGDVHPSAEWLVEPLISYRWPSYDVAFPAHRRTLDTEYRSITSERFAAVLRTRSRGVGGSRSGRLNHGLASDVQSTSQIARPTPTSSWLR